MDEIKISKYSNTVEFHQLLYTTLKRKLITLGVFVIHFSLLWWHYDFNWVYIIFPILVTITMIDIPFADIIKFRSQQLICKLSESEVVTLDGYHVPIKNIKSVEFLSIPGNRNSQYDISLILKTSTKIKLFVELTPKHTIQAHEHLKMYLDMPYVYLKDGGLLKDKSFSNITEIL